MFENSVELKLEAKVQGDMGRIELDCIVFELDALCLNASSSSSS